MLDLLDAPNRPSEARRRQLFSADIFSLGISLYEMSAQVSPRQQEAEEEANAANAAAANAAAANGGMGGMGGMGENVCGMGEAKDATTTTGATGGGGEGGETLSQGGGKVGGGGGAQSSSSSSSSSQSSSTAPSASFRLGRGGLPAGGRAWQDLRNGDAPRPPGVRDETWDLVMSMMRPHGEERPTAADVVSEATRLLVRGGQQWQLRHPSFPQSFPQSSPRLNESLHVSVRRPVLCRMSVCRALCRVV